MPDTNVNFATPPETLTATERLLWDGEWSNQSTRETAKKCGVSHDFKARMKHEREPEVSSDDALPPPNGQQAAPICVGPLADHRKAHALICSVSCQGKRRRRTKG